jgi:hypothetical protein
MAFLGVPHLADGHLDPVADAWFPMVRPSVDTAVFMRVPPRAIPGIDRSSGVGTTQLLALGDIADVGPRYIQPHSLVPAVLAVDLTHVQSITARLAPTRPSPAIPVGHAVVIEPSGAVSIHPLPDGPSQYAFLRESVGGALRPVQVTQGGIHAWLLDQARDGESSVAENPTAARLWGASGERARHIRGVVVVTGGPDPGGTWAEGLDAPMLAAVTQRLGVESGGARPPTFAQAV